MKLSVFKYKGIKGRMNMEAVGKGKEGEGSLGMEQD